jgi:hypothetical protein
MPILILVILWFAAAAGAQINAWLSADPSTALPIERRLFGLATGLVVLAYLVLLIGLLGFLSAGPILACVVALSVLGIREHLRIVQDLVNGCKSIKLTVIGGLSSVFFLIFAATSLIGCFTPPTTAEYDSLSYHLADPKIYLAHHRIISLPWESHSNFAFTMEMLYAIGLCFHSIALAKFFHYTMGVLCVVATFLIGRKAISPIVGLAGSLLLASLPLVFWEAGTAYVDLGATAFGTLGLLAFVTWLNDKEADVAWLRVCVLMMAGMVSIKATSLIPVALFAMAIVVVGQFQSRPFSKSALTAALFTISSVVLGSLWYLKSWIVTGNPFFPFAYSVFGGRHWSASNAATYAKSQAQFGAGHRLLDLVLVPWNLVLDLDPLVTGAKHHPFNDFATFLVSLSPVLLAALFIPALWKRRSPPVVVGFALYGLVNLIIWFFLTQQVRYLLAVMPVYCILAAFVIVEVWSTRLFARYVLAGIFLVSQLFSCLIAWTSLVQPELTLLTGKISRTEYITYGFPAYPAMQFLNESTPVGSGVAFYGEPTDFYCDRPYMWAEPGHGIVIPYDSMHSTSDLRVWFLSHGFQYVFIDYSEAPIAPGPGLNGLVFGLTYGSGNAPVYQHGPISIYAVK